MSVCGACVYMYHVLYHFCLDKMMLELSSQLLQPADQLVIYDTSKKKFKKKLTLHTVNFL